MLTEKRRMDTKVCSQCKEVKTLDGFNKSKASKNGYQSQCKACEKVYQAEYRAANPEKEKERKAKYYAANPEKVKESNDNYRAANPDYHAKWCAANPDYQARYCATNLEKKKEYDAKYYAANSEKEKEYQVEYRAANPDYHAEYYAANIEKIKDYQAEYQKANPEKFRANCANRRAVELEAIPSWLTQEDYKAMQDIHKEAARLTKETGIKHEVDHIIPLQPPKVIMFEGEMIPLICAFHCPANFQILTKSKNCSKGNRFTPYVESELTY